MPLVRPVNKLLFQFGALHYVPRHVLDWAQPLPWVCPYCDQIDEAQVMDEMTFLEHLVDIHLKKDLFTMFKFEDR